MSTQSEPAIETYTNAVGAERVRLFCPSGHEVADSPITSGGGRRLLAGDFSGETCGNISCQWNWPVEVSA